MAYRYYDEDEEYYEEDLQGVDLRVIDKLHRQTTSQKKRRLDKKKNKKEKLLESWQALFCVL